MIRTVEAVVDPSGNVRLLADVHLSGPRRALVTILDDGLQSEDTAILSERALADWSRPEEDAAWSILCQVTSNPGRASCSPPAGS